MNDTDFLEAIYGPRKPDADPACVRQLHLAVDVQRPFFCHLTDLREKTLPKAILGFSNAIRSEIPTIWVVVDNTRYLFPPKPMPGDTIALREFYKLPLIDTNDRILEKPSASAFDNTGLIEHLQNRYPLLEGILVSGLFTSSCVKATLRDCIQTSFAPIALCDLMGEWHEHRVPKQADDPDWHKDILSKQFYGASDQVTFTTAKNFLTEHKKEPAPPVRTTPVPNHLVLKA